MKHILVTGGAGYIGAHACKALAQAGYTPVTFDNLVTGRAASVKFGPMVEGDLMDRTSNNYGPYHFPEKLVPVVILKALAGQPIPIYGAGDNVRDWLYVEDHADALLRVLTQGTVGRSYNIGGGNEATNLDLVRMLCAIMDALCPKATPYADQITFVTDRPGHDKRYAIDATRIRDELDWQPSVTLDEGLQRTVAWYLANEEWWRPLHARNGVGQRLGQIPVQNKPQNTGAA